MRVWKQSSGSVSGAGRKDKPKTRVQYLYLRAAISDTHEFPVYLQW